MDIQEDLPELSPPDKLKKNNNNNREKTNTFEYLYRTKKRSLKSLFSEPHEAEVWIETIQNASERVNYIMFRTYQFTKMFLLFTNEVYEETPKIINNDILFFANLIAKRGQMKLSTTINRNDG